MLNTITNRLTLIRDLNENICKVTFTKQDGSVTTRFVTLCTKPCITMPDRVCDTLRAEVTGADLQNPRANIVVWDIQAKHLISFYPDRVSEFRVVLDIL